MGGSGMLVPGIVSATFRGKKAGDIIRLCVQNGLKGIEWSENAHVFSGKEKEAEQLRRQTLDAGLEVAAYGSYYRLGCSRDPRADFLPSLLAAQALGAPLVRVWAGTIASSEASDEYAATVTSEATLIAGMAEEKQIRIAFEWHKNTLTDTNESAMALLQCANHPNLYCLWQPTVAMSPNQRVEGLRLLKDRLLNLHVYYWPEGKRAPLAGGAQEWKTYLRAVDHSVRRYALLEFVLNNTEEQLAADAVALRKILAEVEGDSFNG